jgi:hypothetical protein
MATPRKRPSRASSFSAPPVEEKVEEKVEETQEIKEVETFLEVAVEEVLEEVERKEEILPAITPMPDPGPRFVEKEEAPKPTPTLQKPPARPVPEAKPRHPRNIPKFSRHKGL